MSPWLRGDWWSVTSSEVHICDCTPLSMLEFLLLTIKETTKWSRSGQRNLLNPAGSSSCVCYVISGDFIRSSGFGVPCAMCISAILCWKTQRGSGDNEGKEAPNACHGRAFAPPSIMEVSLALLWPTKNKAGTLIITVWKKTGLEDTQGGNLVWPYANSSRHLFLWCVSLTLPAVVSPPASQVISNGLCKTICNL